MPRLVSVEFADTGTKTGTHRVLVVGGCSDATAGGDIGISLEMSQNASEGTAAGIRCGAVIYRDAPTDMVPKEESCAKRCQGRSPLSRVLSMLAFEPSKLYDWRHSTMEESSVAQLIVRDLSKDLVKALKQRAAKRNRSTEQEHREILQSVLRSPKRRHLADVLAAIPNVGEQSDFGREQSDKRG